MAMEKFDFSKTEDQKKFDTLPEKEREEIVDKAREGAEKIEEGRKEFINWLSSNLLSDYYKHINYAKEIQKEYNLPEEIVQQAAKEAFIKRLSDGEFNKPKIIKNTFNLPEEIVQQAAKEAFIKRLSVGGVDDAKEIQKEYNLPEEIVQQAAKEAFINCLSSGSIEYSNKIKEEFNLPEEFIQSNKIQQAAKSGFINCLLESSFYGANKIKEELNLPEEFIQSNKIKQAVRKGIINRLSSGDIDYAINEVIEDKKEFGLPEEIVQQAAKEKFVDFLINRFFYGAKKIKEKFNLPEEIVQQAAKEAFINCLSVGGVDDAIKIKEEFSINIQPKEIIEKVPKIKEFLDKIKPVSLQFYEQAQRSTDLIIELFEFVNNQDTFFTTIEKNPFLVDAVLENTRFGSKLLLKYPKLDELSKQNIEFLFDTKKEILKENPDIDPESLEFRQLMQEKLKNYEDNPDIVEEMKRNGINIDRWLNYEEASHFSLESGKSKLAFSETVSTPLNRIKETIGSYAYQIKEVLKEYKQELSEHQIPVENPKDIEDKIAQMREEQEKARAEGNDKKTQGIQKGIDGLTQKLADLKTVSSWHKILGDINAFDQLKNDVFGTQEKLIQAENEFAEKTSGKTPSGKEIQDAKQRIAKAKEELRNKFGLLENRIENFKTNLPNLIEPALGKERADSLIQEIETNLVEQFDHYNTDRSDLANLFSEKSDKEKDKMDSQPMSIFVWARNPDIDLYQGNYSECCIKINSDHMGAESTIADYNTDLGVQIVNIWDETKNEPVTAAWCWIGKSEKGKPVLVVDNIESNPVYSRNYPEQLTKELFDYLKNYAKSIGVKKIVLGKANNDLPTGGELAKLIDDKSEYEKIGGYNRADGYFLEAEDKSVKIVWEAKRKEEEIKENSKLEALKIEFTEANARDLNENDFETIKKMERKVYRGTDLIQGQAMIEDIKNGKGLDYSNILYGKNSKTGKVEAVGYIVAVEDETDEGDKSVYLEDVAVLPEAQRQGLGWKILKELAEKLKAKSAKEGKPVLFDMHLREDSQRFLDRHRRDLEEMGVKLIEEALVADYYDEGEDALYQVYEVKND